MSTQMCLACGGGFTEGAQTCPHCGRSAKNVAHQSPPLSTSAPTNVHQCQPMPTNAPTNAHPDPINPDHYRQGTLEVIDAIEGLALGYREGNCLKYLARYKYKNGVEDLRKARWYLDRLIKEQEQEQGQGA